MGRYYYGIKVHEEALENLINSFNISKEHLNRSPKELFKKICMIGDCETVVRTLKEALESYLCGETIIKSNPSAFDLKDRFSLYKKIAEVHRRSENPDQSIIYCEHALDIFEQSGTDIACFEAAAVQYIRAQALSCLEKHDEAIRGFEAAIELYRRDKSPKCQLEISRCYFSIGQDYLKVTPSDQSKRTEQAIEHFELSLRVRKDNNEPMNSELGVIYTQKGLALTTVNRYKEAKEDYLMALSLFAGNRKKDIMERYRLLTQLSQPRHHPERAQRARRRKGEPREELGSRERRYPEGGVPQNQVPGDSRLDILPRKRLRKG